MINSFRTLFEARDLKFQQERLFRGESVDLVAKITTDGVMDNLSGYSISGVYQPTDELSGPFYPLDAEIVNGTAILHWTGENDFGRDAYNVWGLLEKDGKAAYPICWRISLQHSPSYPLSSVDPIPRTIDFSQYDLINAPWVELSALDEIKEDVVLSALEQVDGRYLPLSGGVVSGDFEVKDFLKGANRCLVIGKNIWQHYQDRGVAVGTNLSTDVAAVAIGDNTKAGNSSIAIGQSSIAGDGTAILIGNNSFAYANGIAIGSQTSADTSQCIAIGTKAEAKHAYEVRLGGPYDPNYGHPALFVHNVPILSGSDHRIPKERLPYLNDYATEDWVEEYVAEHGGDLSNYLPLSGGYFPGAHRLSTLDIVFSRATEQGGNLLSVSFNHGQVAIGQNSKAGDDRIYDGGAIAIGGSSLASEYCSIAIGGGAKALADRAIQIGQGTNSEVSSLQVIDWKLLDQNGNIPEARLSSTLTAYAKLSDIPTIPDDLVHEDELTAYAQLSDVPEVPTDLSAFTNSPGYLTAHQSLSGYLPLSGGTLSATYFKWLASDGSTNILSTNGATTTALGFNSNASLWGATAIGTQAAATGTLDVAIGWNAKAHGVQAVAIGSSATATARGGIQLGYGTNNVVSSLQVYDWQLLDGSGNIPEGRLSSVLTSYATESYVDTKIGDIDSILDSINGEII